MKSSQSTILVTGGAGFIGSHLVDRLLTEEHEVVCLDNFDDFYAPKNKRMNLQAAMENPNFILVEGDIRDMKCLRKLFEQHRKTAADKDLIVGRLLRKPRNQRDCFGSLATSVAADKDLIVGRLLRKPRNRIEKVVHLAARAGVRASIACPQLYEEINTKGTLNLLDVCKEFQIKQFIYGSSSSVYGINPKVPFSETDEVGMPISPYAASKRAGELFCYTYHHLYNIPVTCLRFFTVYGPRQRPEMAIHKFTRLIDEGEEVPMFGDGTSQRDYTYISDIIDGVMRALDIPFEFEIFNLGESRTVELRYLIRCIEQNLGKTANIKILPPQPGDVPITFADISKARALLSYSPRVDIEVGMQQFVAWYRVDAS